MTALTIAGSDSGGGAGVQADLKTFAAFGVHGVSVVTSLTAQNTQGVEAIFDLPMEFIKAQFSAIHRDFNVKAAKTGMLSNKEIIEVVAEEVGDYPLVVDPVMLAQSGDRLLREDAVDALKHRLFPRALVVTPNVPEAEVLSGLKIKSVEDMKRACEAISELGCSVVVKGGHLNATDVMYHQGECSVFKGKKFDFSVHGSGCTFASAIAACLVKGRDLNDAVSQAKDFISTAIASSYIPGKGARVANQFGGVLKEAEKYRVLSELRSVVCKIVENKEVYRLVPEVGMNIVYALPGGRSLGDLAGVRGRIVRMGDRVRACEVDFGASKHVGSIVLAAMNFDPAVRCAMNIRYSGDSVEMLKEKFTVSTFDRKQEPGGVSTMEWGTTQAIKDLGSVPDVIYDTGAVGKEAMIRVLGRTPSEVWGKVCILLSL